MNIVKSRIFLGGILVAIFATILGIFNVASANPFFFMVTDRSATATTTVAYITAGTGTTTNEFDTRSVSPSFGINHATLFVQMGASSTGSVLDINIEYSQDGTDWYEDGGTMTTNYASTTKPFILSPVQKYQLGFASSTPGGVGVGGASDATTTRAVLVKTPTRYIRAVFTVPIGATAANVWSEWVPVREASE